jgi:hypothetical protein
MNNVLVFTSQLTVERAPVLDPIALTDLGTWLCQSASYHDSDMYWKDTEEHQRLFEQQRKDNHGFCDYCRDHAGALLVTFEVRKR